LFELKIGWGGGNVGGRGDAFKGGVELTGGGGFDI